VACFRVVLYSTKTVFDQPRSCRIQPRLVLPLRLQQSSLLRSLACDGNAWACETEILQGLAYWRSVRFPLPSRMQDATPLARLRLSRFICALQCCSSLRQILLRSAASPSHPSGRLLRSSILVTRITNGIIASPSISRCLYRRPMRFLVLPIGRLRVNLASACVRVCVCNVAVRATCPLAPINYNALFTWTDVRTRQFTAGKRTSFRRGTAL
jgi:hypothetical protein